MCVCLFFVVPATQHLQVRFGKQSKVFHMDKCKTDEAHLCFALLGRHFTLNIIAPSEEAKRAWLRGLAYLMESEGVGKKADSLDDKAHYELEGQELNAWDDTRGGPQQLMKGGNMHYADGTVYDSLTEKQHTLLEWMRPKGPEEALSNDWQQHFTRYTLWAGGDKGVCSFPLMVNHKVMDRVVTSAHSEQFNAVRAMNFPLRERGGKVGWGTF